MIKIIQLGILWEWSVRGDCGAGLERILLGGVSHRGIGGYWSIVRVGGMFVFEGMLSSWRGRIFGQEVLIFGDEVIFMCFVIRKI